LRDHVLSLLVQALARVAPEADPALVQVERPKVASHGDFSCNLAMQLARGLKRAPRELAQALIDALPASDWLDTAEIAGPGFINLRLAAQALQRVVGRVFAQGDAFGQTDLGGGRPVMVEFVSANPTGPLHVGHGRQGALGAALCALLEATGHRVTREFYYNDAGVQIENLARSVEARAREAAGEAIEFPADGYHGQYIRDIAADFLARRSVTAADGESVSASGDLADHDGIRRFAVAYLRHEQDMDLQAFGVRFDNFYLESSLYADGSVAQTVRSLTEAGKTYEHEGALWLRTTEYGDDKDRVMRKSDGSWTYFVPDVAYHVAKWRRGFTTAINIMGSDHFGSTTRVRAGLQGLDLGIPADYPRYLLHKMVTVMRGGEEVKISKRAGSYVTLRDLIDEVGRDAVRFFLVSRKADTEFVFDVDLAKAQTEENPVYYVQYAHARICSVMSQWGGESAELAHASVAALTGERELAVLRRLDDFPLVLALAAADCAPHLVAFYLRDLAADFHGYYNAERFLVDDPAVRLARMALAAATRQVLRNGLCLLGVGAPEKM
jgi:arginyl-tRNA synthetase